MQEREHRDTLSLVELADGRAVVFNSLSGEVAQLPDDRKPWRLVFLSTAMGLLVDRHGVEHLPSEFLDIIVWRCDRGELHVQGPGAARMQPLNDRRARKVFGVRKLHVVLSLEGPVREWHTKLWQFEMPIAGAKVMWELRRLQPVLFGENATMFYLGHRFLQNRWPRFVALLETLGLDMAHLRRAKGTKHTSEDKRYFYGQESEASCSTYALVAFLAVWAGTWRSSARSAAKAALKSLLLGCFRTEVIEISLALDPDASQVCGLTPCGRRHWVVYVSEGSFVVGGLLEVDDPCIAALRRHIGPLVSNGRMDVAQALEVLGGLAEQRAGRSTNWLFRQLVFGIADVLDQLVFEKGWSQDFAKDGYKPLKHQRKDRDMDESKVLGLTGEASGDEEQALGRCHYHHIRGLACLSLRVIVLRPGGGRAQGAGAPGALGPRRPPRAGIRALWLGPEAPGPHALVSGALVRWGTWAPGSRSPALESRVGSYFPFCFCCLGGVGQGMAGQTQPPKARMGVWSRPLWR